MKCSFGCDFMLSLFYKNKTKKTWLFNETYLSQNHFNKEYLSHFIFSKYEILHSLYLFCQNCSRLFEKRLNHWNDMPCTGSCLWTCCTPMTSVECTSLIGWISIWILCYRKGRKWDVEISQDNKTWDISISYNSVLFHM